MAFGNGTPRSVRFLPPDETGLLVDFEGYQRAYGESLIVTIDGVSQTLAQWLAGGGLSPATLVMVLNAAIAVGAIPVLTAPPSAGFGLWINGGYLCVA